MTTAMRMMKTAALSNAPSNFWAVESEGLSRYTKVAAVRIEFRSGEAGVKAYTKTMTKSMQIDTGDITPMISMPIDSRMLVSMVEEFRQTGTGSSSRREAIATE